MAIFYAIFKHSHVHLYLIWFHLCYIINTHSRKGVFFVLFCVVFFSELSRIILLYTFLFVCFFSSVSLSNFCNIKTCMNRPNYSCCWVFSCIYEKWIDSFPVNLLLRFASDCSIMLLKISSNFIYLKCYQFFYSFSRSSKMYLMTPTLKYWGNFHYPFTILKP